MKNRKKHKAVFLDRDGTLIHLEPGEYVLRTKEIRPLPFASSAVRALNRLGYLVILITNQAAIAKGKTTRREVDRLHAFLIRTFGTKQARIDAVYYCPHHPEGVVKRYALRCRCRKPSPGMILQAIRRYRIDRRRSFLIGDTTGDILAGKRAKLRTILVKTGYGGNDKKHDVRPDFVAKNLSGAIAHIRTHAS